ncbi:MAG: hypothetical protein NZ108_10430, partial [Bacteroidia bacterium]|nr:hypothetical protein [Bacteroidia bacterium]
MLLERILRFLVALLLIIAFTLNLVSGQGIFRPEGKVCTGPGCKQVHTHKKYKSLPFLNNKANRPITLKHQRKYNQGGQKQYAIRHKPKYGNVKFRSYAIKHKNRRQGVVIKPFAVGHSHKYNGGKTKAFAIKHKTNYRKFNQSVWSSKGINLNRRFMATASPRHYNFARKSYAVASRKSYQKLLKAYASGSVRHQNLGRKIGILAGGG